MEAVFKIIRNTQPLLNTPHLQAGKTVLELLREFNAQDAINNDHKALTVYKYKNFIENFARYLESRQQPQLPIEAYSMQTLRDFTGWLKNNLKSCDKTTLSKHIYRINRGIDYAVILGHIPYNPSAAFKIKRANNKEVVSLEHTEFTTWITATWESEIYQSAQDNHSFQMVTALAYADLYSYSTYTDEMGLWIQGRRTKTGRPYFIPLWHPEFELARQIHEKHKGKLPFIENGAYNRILREMAAILGISKYLTSHVGRKTFATLKGKYGWADAPISSIMGCTEKVLNAHYKNPAKDNIIRELSLRGAM